jgi:hypothetical protein
MPWEAGTFWINGHEGIGYVFGPYTPTFVLEYVVARPTVFMTKLRTEPVSVSNGPGAGPVGESREWVLHTVVTNQTNGSTWFTFVGSTLP